MTPRRRRPLARFAIACVVALIASVPAAASQPGTDEARAGICDAFAGVAFTFCVAYCEARECDRQPRGDERCVLLRQGFDRATGGITPPCVETARQQRS